MTEPLFNRAARNEHYDIKKEACATCRFWKPRMAGLQNGINDNAFGDGHCRFNPPMIIEHLAAAVAGTPRLGAMESIDEFWGISEAVDATQFPATWMSEWCGRFEWLADLEPMECGI